MASLKITGNLYHPSVSNRFEWFVGAVALKHNHSGRNGGAEIEPREQT